MQLAFRFSKGCIVSQQRPSGRDEKPGSGLRSASLAVMIPTTMGACVLVGCFIGYKLDQFFGTKPWLSLLFLVFGMAAGIRETARIIRRINEEQK